MFASLFVIILGLCFCCKESNQIYLEAPVLSGPSEAEVKKVAVFTCELPYHPMNESILLELYNTRDYDRRLGEYTSLEGEPGSFLFVIKLYHEGDLQCAARPQNRSYIEPKFGNIHHLRVIQPVKGAEILIRSGLQEFFEGHRLELFCKITAGNYVSYKWLLSDQPISQAPGVYLSDGQLLISRTTSEDSGFYRCEASNKASETVFTSNSSEVVITVKDVVSTPDISFTVLKESHNYSAIVTCQSTRGTPPVTFSLYNREELVTNVTSEDRSAIFQVPVILDRHMGYLQCQANNGDHTAYSQWLPLEVVAVGGPVTMHHGTDIGENYAATGLRFYCKAAKGSHPQYHWFLNNTLLHERGSFYMVHQDAEQSVLLLAVGRRSAGIYRCAVSNNFDNTTAISSKGIYMDKEVLNHLNVLVVAVVFGSFIFLILMVAVCCGIGVVSRQRQYGEKSLPELEMERMTVAYEGELGECEYNEDADMMRTTTGDEPDQASEASVDEWPQIVEQKKMLEDEPIEL